MATFRAGHQKLTTPRGIAGQPYHTFDTRRLRRYICHIYGTCQMTSSPVPLPPPRRVLTTNEVAEILRVSPPTVRSLKNRGELHALAGIRTLRFTAATVTAFLDRKPKP